MHGVNTSLSTRSWIAERIKLSINACKARHGTYLVLNRIYGVRYRIAKRKQKEMMPPVRSWNGSRLTLLFRSAKKRDAEASLVLI